MIIYIIEIAYVISFKTQMLLPFFDLDGEANLPTWSSSALFSFAGFLAIGVHIYGNKNKSFWLIVGLCCLFVSMDEVSQFHETMSVFTGIKWIYIYGPIGAAIIIFLTKTAYSQWTAHPNMKIVMLGVMIGFVLSVGLETISYFGLTSLWQKVEFMLEEGSEMLGAGMILIGCLQELIPIMRNTENTV